MAERRYSISQAGRLVGVENHVLRYWEDELHLEIPRDRKNQRYYTKLHIEMFQKINELKEKGYQLKAIEPVLKRMQRRFCGRHGSPGHRCRMLRKPGQSRKMYTAMRRHLSRMGRRRTE